MKNRYCRFSFISLNAGLLESAAWNELTLSQIQVFIYIWSCLQWGKVKKREKSVPANNDDIEISTVKMKDKLGICKATCTTAVHKLIEVGLIRLTRVG